MVELKILRYQFPDHNIAGDWDSNWLDIYLKVSSKLGRWETVHPSLTTFEIKEIISWFRDLSENRQVQYPELYFTEPNIEFQLKNSTQESKTIRIVFGLESRPQSAKDGQEYYMDCLLTNQQLAHASLQLENELKFFPER